MLHSQSQRPERSARLRSGLLYLAAWLFVASVEYGLLEDGVGIQELLSHPMDRPYPILLLGVSIVLLALAIRDLSFYFRSSSNSDDRGP